jgi:biopolymer transport protein ExbD
MLTHSRRKDEEEGVQLNYVITPMLDMTFQLLFFFVLTFKPQSAMEGKIDFQLPSTGEAKAQRPEDIDPTKTSDSDLALPAQFTVLVKTVNDGTPNTGNISALIVKTDRGETAVPNLDALEKFLKSQHDSQDVQNKDDIKIEAECKLKYGSLMEVIDACRNGGFQKVGFAPPPDYQQNQ